MEQSENSLYLGREKISRLLGRFSIPCIFSLVVSALYNIVDQIFIGHSELGYLGNAATGIVFPITVIAMAFAWCFGDGAAAFLSLCQGRKDTRQAHACIGSGITVTFLVSLAFIVLCYVFREPLLHAFGASDATIGMSIDYFVIILAGMPVFMILNMMNSVIRADGSPAFAMVSIIAGAVINIILDPVFIFVCGWGIKGAAYATVIGQIVSFGISVIYFFKPKTFILTVRSFIPNLKVFVVAVKLGISTFITQMSIVVVSLACNMMLFKYGTLSIYGPDIPISVISIETKVFTIVINIVVGIILGGQPILGYNYGAKNYARVKETFKIVLYLTLAVGCISTLIFEFFPELIIGIFGTGSALYTDFAMKTFRIFLSLVTCTCVIKMSSIFFQAVGQPVKAAVVSLTRDILCFVPLVIVLPRFMGIEGILFAAPVSDAIAMIVTVCLLVSFFSSLNAKKAADVHGIEQTVTASRKGPIITIARQHGSAGKKIGRLIAEKAGIPFYYKEMTELAARESGLSGEFISDINANSPKILRDVYLNTAAVGQAITAQHAAIRKIAEAGSCVIVGRAADYVLRDNENTVRVFIHAPYEYRLKQVAETYGDTAEQAAEDIRNTDEARAAYYKNVSGQEWGQAVNYHLCIDSSQGAERTADVISEYVSSRS